MSLENWFTGVRWKGHRRPTEETSTKHFLNHIETLTFEVLRHDGAYAQCQGSDGKFYNWLALVDLYKGKKNIATLLGRNYG